MRFPKKAKLFIIITSGILVLASSALVISAKNNKSKDFIVGESYKNTVLSKKDKDKDKVIEIVGNEKIYESEVVYLEWQFDNAPDNMKPFSKSENNRDNIIKKIAKEKLVLADAKRNKIDLSDEEKEQIKKRALESFEKKYKENQDFIDGTGLTKDEYIEDSVNHEINISIELKYIYKILPEILSDGYKTTDEYLQNKIDVYKKNNDYSMAIEIYEAYKEKLYKDAKGKNAN